jgi:hypothetical protein
MPNQDIKQKIDDLQSGTISWPQLRIEASRCPSSLEDLVKIIQDMGHPIESLPMPCGGDRLFGLLGRYRVAGFDCVVKIAGQQLAEDHPDYAEALVRHIAIQQEIEGLKALNGLTPRLVGEITVKSETVGVLRQFVDGMSLIDAVKDKLIAPEDAKEKIRELVNSINDRGFWLWDSEPQNLWFHPDGRVFLIEGQCVVCMTEEDHQDPEFPDKQNRIVEVLLGACLGGSEQ